MNIGIRLHDTAGNTLREHLRNAHAQGFACAHIAMQKVLPGFAMPDAPRLLTDALAEETKSALADSAMDCAVLGCYLNLATPDEEAYRKTAECYRAHLRFAVKIGALVTGTETGAPNTDYRSCPECHTEEALSLFIERLRPIVQYAEEVGGVIAIEPVCRHIVSTPERAERVLDAIHSDALQIILDTVNLLTPRNHEQMPLLVEESIRRFGDRIRVLHMKDYRIEEGRTDVLSVACGRGVMDYTPLLTFAKAHEGIPMTLEDTKPDHAEASRLFLEEKASAL